VASGASARPAWKVCVSAVVDCGVADVPGSMPATAGQMVCGRAGGTLSAQAGMPLPGVCRPTYQSLKALPMMWEDAGCMLWGREYASACVCSRCFSCCVWLWMHELAWPKMLGRVHSLCESCIPPHLG
jgi:hypothetical protein